MDALILYVAVVSAGAGVTAYGLTMRDLVRRGRLHRRSEELARLGMPPALPGGRVSCPECAEAILPQARRCPFCRSALAGTGWGRGRDGVGTELDASPPRDALPPGVP
jgi:hypothetical protein